jgi:hypothetical protein
MNNGVEIPLGKQISLKNNQNNFIVGMHEYVVYESSQIRMRYLIQIENNNNN